MDTFDLQPARGWSMRHGHRRQHGKVEDDVLYGRSVAKRSINNSSRNQWCAFEGESSHQQWRRVWQTMMEDKEVFESDDWVEEWFDEAEELVLSESEEELDWNDGASSTQSTAASAQDAPLRPRKAKGARKPRSLTRWDAAAQQATQAASQYQLAKQTPRRTRKGPEDAEVDHLTNNLQDRYRMRLCCPELSQRSSDPFERLRFDFLSRFGGEVCSVLAPLYGDAVLRAAPVAQPLRQRFKEQVEKHKEKLQVVLHGTNEKNLNSIYQKGLLVPSCDNNVKVLHGSSHGKGIYTAKTINARLAYGFALGSSRALLVCGVIDDAVALPERVACGNHFITAQSDHVRHVGDAIVVFDESRLLPLFEVSHATPQLAPPPAHGTTSAPAAPAVSRAPLPVPGKSRGKLDGPKTRLPKKYCPHTERRAARKRRL
ncbi:unnamed protein product [Effrenium voratum]|uniref:PARP catalytic domain-containing protein n=1 Tax=Effrenium voratum TaxID=2562239 RepID=A0AA36JJA3_9DINO|nr:unnamed protein product [Effrenium voratum]CAJ1421093.1 unnamed protein product [Effrenium voratum]